MYGLLMGRLACIPAEMQIYDSVMPFLLCTRKQIQSRCLALSELRYMSESSRVHQYSLGQEIVERYNRACAWAMT
jgi:hypothetical protein